LVPAPVHSSECSVLGVLWGDGGLIVKVARELDVPPHWCVVFGLLPASFTGSFSSGFLHLLNYIVN